MRKKVKIAVLIDQLIPAGVQKAAIAEVKYLRKFGYNAKLLVLMQTGFEKKFGSWVKNIPYEFLSDRYPKIFRKSFKLPLFRFLSSLHLLSPVLAPTRVKNSEFDLIISHGTTTSFTALALAKIEKIPYFTVIHDPMVYILDKIYSQNNLGRFLKIAKSFIFFLESHLIKSAATCIVDSKVHQVSIEKRYGVKPAVIYLGTDHHQKISNGQGSEILAFSRWDKGKNPELLLELAKTFPHNKFIIAGLWTSKKDLSDFKEQIKRIGLTQQIELLTFVKEQDLPKLFKRALVYIHPHFEAFGLAALEAAANGYPVIIPQGSGVTEILQDSADGFFPKEVNLGDFKLALKKLISNPEKAHQMGTSAYKKIKKYTWEYHSRKLEKLIKTLIPPDSPIHIVAIEAGHASKKALAGGDILLEKMAPYISKKFKLSVITPKVGFPHWQNHKMVTVYHLPKNIFDKLKNKLLIFFSYLVRSFQTLSLLRKLDLRIIYSSTDVLPDILPAFFYKLTHPKKYWIARIHHLISSPNERAGNFLVNFATYFIQKVMIKLMRTADKTIVLNEVLYRQLIAEGFTSSKLAILGGGVDFKRISSFGSKKHHYDGIFVGRMHQTKGVFDLPEIWQRVTKAEPRAKLAIVGEENRRIKEQLLKKIKFYNLEKNIFFLGFLSEKKLYQTLFGSKVFLFTDHEAGFGLAVAEAMAAGLPVVGWDIGILGSVFKAGFVKIPLKNYQLFAKKIAEILKNKKLHQELSREAIRESAKLSWQETAKKIEVILDKVLS